MSGFINDVRFLMRKAGHSPLLFAIVVLSLALGIGANAAFYALFRGLLTRPLPVNRPERLVLLHWGAAQSPANIVHSGDSQPRDARWRVASRSFSYPFVQQLRQRTDVFEAAFAFAPLGFGRRDVTLGGAGNATRVDGDMVTGDYFRSLGVRVSPGRELTRHDEAAGSRVAVISHRCWTDRFSQRPDIVGTVVSLNAVPFEIIGVAAPGFSGVEPGRAPDVWIPVMDVAALPAWGSRPDVRQTLDAPHYWWLKVMARLRDGVEPEGAAGAIASDLERHVRDVLPGPQPGGGPALALESGRSGVDVLRRTYEDPLRLLMGAAAAVLLVACANVAVLLLAHASGRRGEFAVRLSLGASRARLVRQLLTESVALSLLAAAAGVLCAGWISRALLSLIPVARRPIIDGYMDAAVVVLCITLAVAVSVIFGCVPALIARRSTASAVLRETSAAGRETRLHHTWSAVLISAQIAVSLVLVLGATLFVRSLANLRGEPLGVERNALVTFPADASQLGRSGAALTERYKALLRGVEAVGGVESATVSRLRLFSGSISLAPVSVGGGQPSLGAQWNAVGPSFATTMGIAVIAGRDFGWPDVEGGRRVALVNEVLAEKLFGGGNAVGRQLMVGDPGPGAVAYEIVGVVGKAKYGSVRGDFPRTMYLPFTAAPAPVRGLFFHVRSRTDPAALAPQLREAAARVDPGLPIVDLQTMGEQVEDSLWQERVFARLTSAFGAAALLLACIGVYGSLSYGVTRRRAEIALRLALGAPRRSVLLGTLRGALVPAVVGLLIGVPAALWAARFASAFLFELTPWDPAMLALAAAVLLATAGLAAYLPARRALQVEPALTLRGQ